MTEVITLARAEAELFEKFTALHEAHPASAKAFDVDVDEAMFMLAHHPMFASRWRGFPIRCYRLRRWHFGLFYTIESRRVMIVAAQDMRQDPKTIERRLGLA